MTGKPASIQRTSKPIRCTATRLLPPPPAPPVRTSAMRSDGRSSRSTNAWRARCMFRRLSTESPRSSTTTATVRWTSSRLIAVGGDGTKDFRLGMRWRGIGRHGPRKHRHELGERDLLQLAVLPHLEIVRRQVGDDAAVAIRHDCIEAHGVYSDPEARRLTCLLG